MIARESIILGKIHEHIDLSIPMNVQGVKHVNKTIIEDDVWIGLRVIIIDYTVFSVIRQDIIIFPTRIIL